MTLRAWRITKARHAASAFSGEGARLNGGHWNSSGVSVVYLAANLSAAMLEVLVHVQDVSLLSSYVAMEATFDDSLVTEVNPDELAEGWSNWPPSAQTQRVGDEWAASGSSVLLRIPSAIVSVKQAYPQECNYLLNPAHRDFDRIRISDAQPISFARFVRG